MLENVNKVSQKSDFKHKKKASNTKSTSPVVSRNNTIILMKKI